MKGMASALPISIHAPREGCDQDYGEIDAPAELISIHAPREGCDQDASINALGLAISIHAPREGCDNRMRTHC